MKSITKYCGWLAVSIALLLSLVSCAQSKTEQIVVLKKPGLPVVYFRVMISAGSAMDPTAKPGLAYFTANLLNKGTTSYTRDQLEDKLSQIGAQIGISVDKEVVVITGKTLAEKSRRVLFDLPRSSHGPDLRRRSGQENAIGAA